MITGPAALYANSGALARACPPIRCSRPAALDNTEHFSFDEQRMVDPAKVVLCFDCQQPIESGKGIQVTRLLHAPTRFVTTNTLVHPECEIAATGQVYVLGR